MVVGPEVVEIIMTISELALKKTWGRSLNVSTAWK
jgi:hypothetical protein